MVAAGTNQPRQGPEQDQLYRPVLQAIFNVLLFPSEDSILEKLSWFRMTLRLQNESSTIHQKVHINELFQLNPLGIQNPQGIIIFFEANH